MPKVPKKDYEKIRYYNIEISKKKMELSKLDYYTKLLQSLVPLIELAHKMSAKADIDEGRAKKTWQMILADILIMKEEASEEYSGLADVMQDMVEEVKKLEEGA